MVKNLPANVRDIRDSGSLGQKDPVPWRRAWQPTPVFLPRQSQGQRSLAGYGPQGPKDLDTTDVT